MADDPNQLVPLMCVQAGMPVGSAVGQTAMPDGSGAVVLRLEHGTGTTVVIVPPEQADALGRMLTEQAAKARLHVGTSDLLRGLPGNGHRP